MGIRASEEGLKRIQAAIKARGWQPGSDQWVDLVVEVNRPLIDHPNIDRRLEKFHKSSWQRFVKNKTGVSLQKFRWCCQRLTGIWEALAQAPGDDLWKMKAYHPRNFGGVVRRWG
jgi:hypothetical protein